MDAAHSWHPFTQMQEYLERGPIHISHGQGVWLYDTEGRGYLDSNASNWTRVFGHSDKEISEALINQVNRHQQSSYKDLSHPSASKLSGLLGEVAPEGLTRSFYTDNGSCAIECAMKQSFQYWQQVGKPEKQGCIGMCEGYHGDTFGAMAVGNAEFFHGRFKFGFLECDHFPAPRCLEQNGEELWVENNAALEHLEALLKQKAKTTAFVIMEPLVQGPAGMKFLPRGFLKQVSNLCKAYEVHLILDEIFVGMGRLGTMFACEQEGVVPDFLCLSKGVTGGYLPIGVTLSTEEVYEAFLGPFEEYKTFFHGHTYAANPLVTETAYHATKKLQGYLKTDSCRAAMEYFGRTCVEAFRDHPFVTNVRQRGFVFAMDVCNEDKTKTYPYGKRIGFGISLEALKQGLLLRPMGNTLLFTPPLNISEEEVDLMCRLTSESILASDKSLWG